MFTWEMVQHLKDKDRLAFSKRHHNQFYYIEYSIQVLFRGYDNPDTLLKPLFKELQIIINHIHANSSQEINVKLARSKNKYILAFRKKHYTQFLFIRKSITNIIFSYSNPDIPLKPLWYELEMIIDHTWGRACRKRNAKNGNKHLKDLIAMSEAIRN